MANETVREVIEELTRAAASLPRGLDALFELCICDEHDLQLISNLDVDFWVFVDMSAKPPVPKHGSVVMRGHWHRGESPGKVWHGAAAAADEALREMTEGDQGPQERS
jgi:hypothetical protein